MRNHPRTIAPLIVLALLLTSVPAASAAPTIATVAPSSGSSNGGDLVTITGTGFDAPTVMFGGVPAWVQSATDTSLTVVAPPHAAGAVTVSVKNAVGDPALKTSGYTYAAAGDPTLTELAPASGPASGGTEVTLTGTGFAAGATVKFGNDLASVVYVSPQEIKATAAPSAAGSKDVRVTNPDGAATAALQFEYTADALAITGISPEAGPAGGGMHVTITGTGFNQPSVKFESIEVPIIQATPTSITVQAPTRSPGTSIVEVRNPGGATATTSFDSLPDLEIMAVMPATVPSRGGDGISITASGLPSGSVRVLVGGVEAPGCVLVASSTVGCKAPPLPAGPKDIVLTSLVSGLSARVNGALTYEASAAPTMQAVVLNTGDSNGGQEILIGGSGFSVVAGHLPAVWLGDVQVPEEAVYVADEDQDCACAIRVVVPPRSGIEEDVEVRARVVNPDGTSTSAAPCTQGDAVDPGCFRYQKAVAPGEFTVEPATDASIGGQTVMITGPDIHQDAVITIGGVDAAQVDHGGADGGVYTTVTAPARADVPAGGLTVDVTVTNPDGQAKTAFDAFTYTPAPAPTSEFAGAQGPALGGTEVTIEGTGFAKANPALVLIGDVPVPPELVVVESSTRLRFTTVGGPPGPHDVKIWNPDGQSVTLKDAMVYTSSAAPVLASVTPAVAPSSGDVPMVLAGSGFSAGAGIDLDGTLLAPVTASANSLEFILPSGDPGTRQIKLVNPDGQQSNEIGIRYLPPVGLLSTISPQTSSENGGIGVVLAGTGLPVTGVSLRLGGAVMPMSGTASTTSIPATAPVVTIESDEAQRAVAVADAFGQTSSLWPFTYTAAPDPTCTSAAPRTVGVNPGTQVTLTGTGFAPGARVAIEDEAYGLRTIPAVVASATSLAFTAPAGSFGPVDIRVTNPNGATCTIAGAFGYAPVINPTLTAVEPAGGSLAGGEQITLTGFNFRAGATVKFGSVEAAATALTSTTITVTAPPREEAAVVDVHVVNPGGLTATLAEAYTYSTLPAPTITTISPATGPSLGGTTITVAGTGFLDGATISFGGAMASNVQVNEAGTSLTAMTPARSPGAADVVLVNPDGQATSKTDVFTYTASPAPSITGITPSAGPATGGTTITVTGTHFAPGATMRVGTLLATGITVNSAGTQITATVPAGSGTQSITVRNPDAQEASITDAFTYWVPELIDVAQANADLIATVKITRSAPDNIIEWDLDALSQPPTGVQIWRSTSPFELLASLEGHDARGPYTDAVVTPNARYLVTVYYAKTAEGGFVTDVLSAPGYESQEQALSSAATIISDDSQWGIPLWVIIAAATAALVGITFALLRRRQRASPVSEGDDEDDTAGEEAASPAQALENPVSKDSPGPAPGPVTQAEEWNPARSTASSAGAPPSWRLDCPRCSHTFTAMGIKPLRTSCPQCGVPGTLT